jgi:hypothetical protein
MVRRGVILLLAFSWLATSSSATVCRALCGLGICPEQRAAECATTGKQQPVKPDPGCAAHHHTVLNGVVPAGIPSNSLARMNLSVAPAAMSAMWTAPFAISPRLFFANAPPDRNSGRSLCLKTSVLRV